MAKIQINSNPIMIRSVVLRKDRDYLNELSKNRALNPTGTTAALMSGAIAAFLTKKPHEEPGWSWVRPEGYYVYVNGIRKKNGNWLPLNPQIVDVHVKDRTITSSHILAELQKIANDEKVPKLRVTDTGISMVMFNIIRWMLTELYPPSVYGLKVVEPPKMLNDFNF